jgi:23S rRNA pseudouridine2605 synthase
MSEKMDQPNDPVLPPSGEKRVSYPKRSERQPRTFSSERRSPTKTPSLYGRPLRGKSISTDNENRFPNRTPRSGFRERIPNPLQTRETFENQEPARIQKWLSEQGLGSRREIEEWVVKGEITVDGMIASLGTKIHGHERIMLRGQPVDLRRLDTNSLEMLIYHKPAGEIVTYDDPHGRPTVFDHLPKPKEGKWVSVGRLDFNSEGLLILTNSGDLAHQLMHPRFQIEREYAVRIRGELAEGTKQALLKGVDLGDEKEARFLSIEDAGGRGSNHWYHVTLSEGRYREVRRMLDAVGYEVNRLIRVRYGHYKLPPQLNIGKYLRFYGEKVLDVFTQISEEKIKEKRKDTAGFTGFLRGTAMKRLHQEQQRGTPSDQVRESQGSQPFGRNRGQRQNEPEVVSVSEKRGGLRFPFKRKDSQRQTNIKSRDGSRTQTTVRESF